MLLSMEKLLHTSFGKLLLIAVLCGLAFSSPSQALATELSIAASDSFVLNDDVSGDTGFDAQTPDEFQTAYVCQTGRVYFCSDARLADHIATSNTWATGPPVQ